MRLPDFLVIGAMKAGTTTLCRDLGAHPGVFFPVVKEPHTLMLPEVLTERGRAQYAALFRGAEAGQRCGEGSTGYTKWPLSAEVPARAREVLGEDLQLIYILRNPIDRCLSHHAHALRAGEVPAAFSRARREDPLLLGCSCYGKQLEAWLEVFPRDNLRVVRFETYMQQRTEGARALWKFLGCQGEGPAIDPAQRYNVGDEQLLPPAALSGLKNKIARSQWYKRNVAPLLSSGLKDKLKSLIYRRAEAEPEAPGAEDAEAMLEAFSHDLPVLRRMVGPDFPLWTAAELEAQLNRLLTPEFSP